MIAVQNTIFIDIDGKFYMGVTRTLLNGLFELDPEPTVASLFYITLKLKDIYPGAPLPACYIGYEFIEMATEDGYKEVVNNLQFAFQPKVKLISSYGVS